MSDKVPPHDMACEAAVLSAVLSSTEEDSAGERWETIEGILQATDFYSPANRRVFEAIRALRAEGQPTDTNTVAHWLKVRNRLSDIGGTTYLISIVDAAPYVVNIGPYAESVARLARQRATIALCQRIAAEGYGHVENLDDWAAAAAKALAEISTSGAQTVDYRPIRDVMIESEMGRVEAERLGLPPKRFPSGLRDLDAKVFFRPGQLAVVGAAAGVGKTSLVGGLVRGFADLPSWTELEQRAFPGEMPHVLLVAMEMSDTEMGDRLLFGAAKVSKARLDRGVLTSEEQAQVVAKADEVARLPIFMMAKPGIRLTDLRRNVRSLARESKDYGYEGGRRGRLRVVVIDYLTLMKLEGRKGATRSEIVGESVRELKVMAMEEELCVVLVSQINRAYSGRKDPRPIMADLRDSGEIEQHADIILFAYRDEVHNPETPMKKFGEVIIAKQRNGQASTRVYLRWKGEYTMFEDLTYEDRMDLDGLLKGSSCLPSSPP